MGAIVLIDTSVYLNVLDIAGWNQDRAQILDDFAQRIEAQDSLLLPMATIWETGNHIADLADGGNRFKYAHKFVSDVKKAMMGEAPYRPTYFPDRDTFLYWLSEFPDYAKRNKSERKTREGVSLADLSMIKEWERTRERHPLSDVILWSLDSDLRSYHHRVKT